MWLIESFKKKKLILFNIFLTLYIGINLVGWERGLVPYFEKKTIYQELVKEEIALKEEVQDERKKVSRKASKTQEPKKRRYRRKKQQSTSKLSDSSDNG